MTDSTEIQSTSAQSTSSAEVPNGNPLAKKRVLPVGTIVKGRLGRYKHPWRRFNQQKTTNKVGVVVGYANVQKSKNVPDGLIHLIRMFYNKKTYRTIRDEIIPLTDQKKYGSHIKKDKELRTKPYFKI